MEVRVSILPTVPITLIKNILPPISILLDLVCLCIIVLNGGMFPPEL